MSKRTKIRADFYKDTLYTWKETLSSDSKVRNRYIKWLEDRVIRAESEANLNIGCVNPRSCGIVRWYENTNEYVCCISLEEAQKYANKYNKLVGEDVCYVDEDVWLLYNEA